jgi:hypothetical protein
MTDIISFYKIPISVADSTKTYFLFDILLPVKYSESTNLKLFTILMKMRTVFCNGRNIDDILASFLDDLLYQLFNMIYIHDSEEEENRISVEGCKTIMIGTRTFQLSNQEKSDFHFHSLMAMTLLSYYHASD